jgi:hypothetical protein
MTESINYLIGWAKYPYFIKLKKMRKEKINYALLVEPETLYPVNYTIKQDGTKVFKKSLLLGKDMTENQIKELYDFVNALIVKWKKTLK